MTPKTFWTIFIKILGLFLIIDSITVVPQAFVTIMYALGSETLTSFILLLAALILTAGFYLIILKYCVYNPSWIINKLKLDQGFEEEKLDISLDKNTVLTLSAIILGGLLFIQGLPSLCKQVFTFCQEESLSGKFGDKPSAGWLVLAAAQTLAGYLIMTNHKTIVSFIDRKNSDHS